MNHPALIVVVTAALGVVAAGGFLLAALGMDGGLSFLTSGSALVLFLLLALGAVWVGRERERHIVRRAERWGFLSRADRKKLAGERSFISVAGFKEMCTRCGDPKLALALYVVLREEFTSASAKNVRERMEALVGRGFPETYGDQLADVLRAFVPAAVKRSDREIPEFADAVVRVGAAFAPAQVAAALRLGDPVYAIDLLETGVSPEYVVAMA